MTTKILSQIFNTVLYTNKRLHYNYMTFPGSELYETLIAQFTSVYIQFSSQSIWFAVAKASVNLIN